MVIFVDTSAVFAMLDADDPNHHAASDALGRHVETGRFVTHNYVVVESCALIQRRLGMRFVRAFVDRLLPLLEVSWVDRASHDRAVARWLGRRRRGASLVDVVSFDLMREQRVRTAFAFDADFEREGFQLLA